MLSYYFGIMFFITINVKLINAKNVKTCNFHILDGCPINTQCSQKNTKCECHPNFDFNENFINDTDYCILNPKSKTVIPHEIVSPTSAANLYQEIPVGSHHLIGGILIPLFIVLIVIGAAYGLKRLEIIRRFREFQMRRRRQPFYEDVMMNQDNDDPPLI